MTKQYKPGCSYGCHRVIEPKACCLKQRGRSTIRRKSDNEILIEVETST